jgi:pSer/pThr/pTyr-binding forkhead associated (FHA) protein
VSGTDLEGLARAAYEAHRSALAGAGPSWEDAGDEEQRAWRVAVSAIAAQNEGTIAEGSPAQALVVQTGDQTHVFHSKFIAGRQGNLSISDEHASSHHALFQPAHTFWYVEDLGSTNGTWLNGRRIFNSQRLKKGDKVKIGHAVITILSV